MSGAPWIVVGCVGAVILISLIWRFTGGRYRHYYLIDSVLTQSERAFFHKSLRKAVPMGYTCCPKVRVADFIGVDVSRKGPGFWKVFGPIGKKHVDFLVCRFPSFEPALVVELDDKTHGLWRRKGRDHFVNQVCKHVNLPVLRVPLTMASDQSWIHSSVALALGSVSYKEVEGV